MTTALNIIQSALEEIHVYAAGQPINASDSTRALEQLNIMLDEWCTDEMMLYTTDEIRVPLIAGKSIYSVGPKVLLADGTDAPLDQQPDIQVARPLVVLHGKGRAYTKDANGTIYPTTVCPSRQEWNRIGNRDNTTGQIVQQVFYEATYPNGTLHLYPVPADGAYTFYFDTLSQFTKFENLADEVKLPRGYVSALQHNLATILHVFFHVSTPLNPKVVQLAYWSKNALKKLNTRIPIQAMEDVLRWRTYQPYNIFRDSQR